MAVGNLVSCQRISRPSGAAPGADLALGEGNLVLKFGDRAGQPFERLTVVTAQRRAQFRLADDPAQVFRHHETRMVASLPVDQMPNFACHDAHRFVTKVVTMKRTRPLLCKGIV